MPVHSYVLYALLCTGATNRFECVQILRLYITYSYKASKLINKLKLIKMNRRDIEKVLNRYWQSGVNFKKELIHIDDEEDLINDLFALYVVSQQRELLLAYHRYLTEELSLDLHELWVDKHLKANNCG